MKNIFLKTLLVLMLALAVPFSPAQEVAPDVLLEAVTTEVLAIIR